MMDTSSTSVPSKTLLLPNAVARKHDLVAPNLGYLELPDKYKEDERDSGKPSWMKQEGFREKFIRKTGENPFVPLGLGLTVAALSYGLYTMKTGDRIMSQRMMRVRVAAQSFTVIALLFGVLYQSTQKKSKDQNET